MARLEWTKCGYQWFHDEWWNDPVEFKRREEELEQKKKLTFGGFGRADQPRQMQTNEQRDHRRFILGVLVIVTALVLWGVGVGYFIRGIVY